MIDQQEELKYDLNNPESEDIIDEDPIYTLLDPIKWGQVSEMYENDYRKKKTNLIERFTESEQ